LLLAAFSAFNRRVLTAAAGIDAEFISAGAAVAELSLRVQRMGFQCRTIPQIEASSDDLCGAEPEGDAELLHDRMRIAALHLDPLRLRAFTARASRLPGYESAAQRLAASDVERKRDAIAAACTFPLDRCLTRGSARVPDGSPRRTRGNRVDATTL
jgi:hypothetical protein